MGLDQYAHSVSQKYARRVEIYEKLKEVSRMAETQEDRERLSSQASEYWDTYVQPERVSIAVWRKHANLNGWMSQLAVEKEVVDTVDQFNCVDLVITLSDLKELKDEITGTGELPHASGFFWGESTPEDYENDLKFISMAEAEIKRGRIILYSCW